MAGLRVIKGKGDVVETLQRALDRAKAGDVDGVAIAEICSDKTLSVCWELGEAECAWARLVAAVSWLQQAMIAEG
jgi:hypothetical protein